MKIKLLVFLAFFALVLALAGFASCGDDDDNEDDSSNGPSDDDDTTDDGSSDDDDDSCPDVIWEYLQIEGVEAPPNPITGDETPPENNKVNYFRFRADTGDDPPRPVSAVLILVPGFTVGAGYLTYMAKNMVELSCGRIEVWIAERRNHLLEDATGMDAAQAAREPKIAYDYYFENQEVNGRTFDGFLNAHNSETGMLSEWGLDIAMKDIRSVIRQVPEPMRQATVFLAGHSRGAAYIKAFAAYEFEDGRLGCEDLAGLVLIDGDTRYNPLLTEGAYLRNIERIRKGTLPRYETLPPFGPPVYTFIEIMAMAASEDFGDPDDPRLGPEGMFMNFGPLTPLLPLVLRFKNIKMTNEAYIGLAGDNESAFVKTLKAGFGALNGPTSKGALGVYPTDENHLYTWLHYDQVAPNEYCEIQDFIRALYEGPSNAMDPYYATRLEFDFWVADVLETQGTWREKYFTFRNSEMDAPVFILGSHILSEKQRRFDFYRSQLPPVRGQDLTRTLFGFEIMLRPEWEHLDTVFAVADGNEFFAGLLNWMAEFSTGEVRVPETGSR